MPPPRGSHGRDLNSSVLGTVGILEERSTPGKPISPHCGPSPHASAAALEERSGAMFKKERNHRAKSTDALALAARGPEPLR